MGAPAYGTQVFWKVTLQGGTQLLLDKVEGERVFNVWQTHPPEHMVQGLDMFGSVFSLLAGTIACMQKIGPNALALMRTYEHQRQE